MNVRRFKRPDRKNNPWALQYRLPDGTRPTRSFPTKTARDQEADRLEKSFARQGTRLAEVDLDEWRDWCAAKEKLAGASLMEAVDHFLTHRKPHEGTASFSAARDRYIEDQKNRGHSVDHIRHLVTAMGTLGEISADPLRMKPDLLQHWFNKVAFVAETKRNYRKYFRAFYNFCEEHGIAVGNPANHVKLPRFVRAEPAIASLEQTQALFAQSWGRDPGTTARMALEAFAGVRASAAGRIQYSDINFKEQGITLRSQPGTKNERRHYIDGLPPTVWSYLDGVGEEEFQAVGSQYMHRKSACVLWAGIQLPKNALRHSFVSYLCAWKKNADLVAYIIGHRKASDILFNHYRGIASATDGEKYFADHTLKKVLASLS